MCQDNRKQRPGGQEVSPVPDEGKPQREHDPSGQELTVGSVPDRLCQDEPVERDKGNRNEGVPRPATKEPTQEAPHDNRRQDGKDYDVHLEYQEEIRARPGNQ